MNFTSKLLTLTFCGLLCTSCSLFTPTQSPAIDAIEVISDLAQGAAIGAPILQLTGVVTSAQVDVIVSASQNTATQCDAAISELKTSDDNPTKIAKIVADFASVPLSVAGLPAPAAALLQGISGAIQQLVKLLSNGQLAQLAKDHPNTPVLPMLSHYDRGRLKAIHKKNQQTVKLALNVHAKLTAPTK